MLRKPYLLDGDRPGHSWMLSCPRIEPMSAYNSRIFFYMMSCFIGGRIGDEFVKNKFAFNSLFLCYCCLFDVTKRLAESRSKHVGERGAEKMMVFDQECVSFILIYSILYIVQNTNISMYIVQEQNRRHVSSSTNICIDKEVSVLRPLRILMFINIFFSFK